MSDRFTQASAELAERNPYLSESCATTFGHPTITHLTDDPGRRIQHHEPEHARRGETIFDDAMPFGD